MYMEIIVKNENKTFLPVLLGTDANAYGMAKSFHKAYGITSLSLGKGVLLETRNSNIVKVNTFDRFDQDDVFLNKMIEVANTYHEYYENLLLVACGDRYSELISEYRDELAKYYVFNYIP